jgi:hypothetical protein
MRDKNPSKLNTSIKQFTREELDELSKEEQNRVYVEDKYDAPEEVLTAEEAATAYQDIRKAYTHLCSKHRDWDDDAIRKEILRVCSPLVTRFHKAYGRYLWWRITDRTVTEAMLKHYEFMIVMRKHIQDGDFTEEGAADIVGRVTNDMTTRDATEEELTTGVVKEKMWEGNPLPRDVTEDPLNKTTGRYLERGGQRVAKVAKEPGVVRLDPSRMAKVEKKDMGQVAKAEVKLLVQEVQRSTTRLGLTNALRKIQRLMNRTPQGTAIDINGLETVFRMKQARASGVWNRDMSDLVGRILRLARQKAKPLAVALTTEDDPPSNEPKVLED